MKYIKMVLPLFLILMIFCSCGKKSQVNATTASTELSTTEVTTAASTVPPETTSKQNTATTKKVNQVQQETEATTEGAKYGDSALLTDPNNKFVDAVIAKYGIERDGLITAYSVKNGDNNYVWQFDGSRDANGKYIRTEKTLKYVYSVTNDCTIVCRTGGYTGNDGCTTKEGLTVFLTTQKILIPNLQEQINAE